jgi:hypothetical protein
VADELDIDTGARGRPRRRKRRPGNERDQLKALVEGHDWTQIGHNTAESTSAAVERDTD